MTPARLKDALMRTYVDMVRNHTLQMAAALAYYFVLSFFPALILLSAIVAYLPVPNLLNPDSSLMLRLLPIESMGLVRRILADVVSPNRRDLLSLGILGTLWATSGGFASAITALNIAYEVKDHRPYWKTRLLAVGLAAVVGALMLTSLSLMIVGPRFGEWLASRVPVSPLWVLLWPYMHWSTVVGLVITILAPRLREVTSAAAGYCGGKKRALGLPRPLPRNRLGAAMHARRRFGSAVAAMPCLPLCAI